MNKNVEEQISALMDGELAENDVPPLLARLRSNPELRERWTRYHLISDALHKNLPSEVGHGLQARVWSALQEEPPILAPRRHARSLRPWMKQAAGVAIAASVTAIAIFSFQAMNPPPGVLPGTQTASTAMESTSTAGAEQAAMTDTDADNEDAALDPYLVNHNEHAVSAGMHGMLPYVRLVSHGGAE